MENSGKLTLPEVRSILFVTADAMHVDWSELHQNGDEYDIALPPPTYGDVRDHDPDLLAEWGEGDSDDTAPLSDEHAEDFSQTDSYHEWADSFQPMMNYAWPVSLAYGGPSAEQAAELINRFASACTLVSFGEGHNPFGDSYSPETPEYAIALTGGGMDLSDRIAVAYLCCGCVPPERILNGLDGFTGCNRSGSLAAASPQLRESYARAADYFRNRAARLDTTLGQLELDEESE